MVWFIYLISPIDLVPDFFIGVGQIDDFLLFFGVIFWAFSTGVSMQLRKSITILRPITPFP